MAFQEHDERFPAALAAGADAEPAWQAVIDIKCHMDRVCHLTLLDEKTVLRLIDQHETNLAASDAQNADAADRAMRHHLTEVLRSLPKVRADRAGLFE
jgi:DNA-binding GntR family transcriptional regulator